MVPGWPLKVEIDGYLSASQNFILWNVGAEFIDANIDEERRIGAKPRTRYAVSHRAWHAGRSDHDIGCAQCGFETCFVLQVYACEALLLCLGNDIGVNVDDGQVGTLLSGIEGDAFTDLTLAK